MGKRGKGPPVKVDKPNGNKNNNSGNCKGKDKRKLPANEPSTNGVQHDTPPDSGVDTKLKSSKVIIDFKCRQLAEEALQKNANTKAEKTDTSAPAAEIIPFKRELRQRTISKSDTANVNNGSSAKKETTKSTPVCDSKESQKPAPCHKSPPRVPRISRELKSLISKPDQTASRTSTCRRKALTKAIKRLRTTSRPQEKPKKSQQTRIQTSPTRSLRSSASNGQKEQKISNKSSKVEKSNSSTVSLKKYELRKPQTKMDYDVKDNDLERESSPSVTSNNRSPSSDSEAEDQTNNEGSGSDTDSDDIEMQVLEKQVESEKEEEEEDDLPEVTLTMPDDTDEESSLLSPSALPASELFRSPSSRRKKRKSLADGGANKNNEKSKKEDFSSKSASTSTSPPYIPRTSPLPSTSAGMYTVSPMSSSSFGSARSYPGKRGRGRPRKALEDVKSVSGKLYRKKMAERMSSTVDDTDLGSSYLFSDYDCSEMNISPYSSSTSVYQNFPTEITGTDNMDSYYQDGVDHNETGDMDPSVDPENVHPRFDRWKDRSTFVYAKHKFVSNENKFKCDTCQVSFTALSSLKRHYGTIYHKQQEAAGRSTLDLTDILRPDREVNTMEDDLLGRSSSPFYPSGSNKGRGGRGGRPNNFARTTSVVRRNAVDNIKKYYAAADAARRRRENHSASATTSSKGNSFTSSWLQKQQRKRKPLLHSEYLYTSASADSEAEDEDEEADDDDTNEDFGCVDEEENNENSMPSNGNNDYYDHGITEAGEETSAQTPWLSNVWKGIGPPHFTCEVCGVKYDRKFEFTAHLFEHRQEEARRLGLTCPDCLIFFPNETLLEYHFDTYNHGIGVIKDGRPTKDIKKFTCKKCNSKFARRDYYRKHLEVYKRPLQQCPHCTKKFLYKFYLNDHIKAKHDGWNSNNGTNHVTTTSNSNNGSVSGGPIPGVTTTTTASNPVTVNPNSGANNIPKPKVELYSNSTLLFATTDTSKRKSSNFSGGTCEAYSNDLEGQDAPSIAGKKKNSSSNSNMLAPPTSRDIIVPTFITCDLFSDEKGSPVGESSTGALEPASSKPRTDTSDLHDHQPAAISPSSSSGDFPNKERVNLLQKFFDSQKEQPPQDPQIERDLLITKGKEDEAASKQVTLGGLGSIGHSTTEDGKIVFQLEHSMFKGFSTMEGEEDVVNTCNLSPLTIEIPRANINIEADEDAAIMDHEQAQPNNSSSAEVQSGGLMPHQNAESVSVLITENTTPVLPAIGESDKDVHKDIYSINSSNSLSTTPSSSSAALQLMGCGVKMNLSVKPQSDNELQCQDCGKIFEHKKSLIKHVRYYSQGESYPCTLCDKSFKLKHHVSRHIKSFHNVDTSSTTSSASDELGLEDHGEVDDKEILLSPPAVAKASGVLCGSGLLAIPSCSSNLLQTSESPHTSKKQFSPSAKRSLSTFAEKSPVATNPERKRSASETSIKKDETDSTSTSSSTPAPITTNSNYTIVIDSKTGLTVFKCSICNRIYPSKIQLRSHLSYHKRTPYKCTLCSSEFKFKVDLNNHLQAHHTDRPKFYCDKCPDGKKSFLSKKDLLKHQREKHSHLGRKPLGGQDHTSSSSSKDQLVTISRCPLCPLVFPQESDLQKHISQEHNKKEALVCRVCGQSWKTVELLQKHKLQEHQIQDEEDTYSSSMTETTNDGVTGGARKHGTQTVSSSHQSPVHVNMIQVAQEPQEELEDEPVEEQPSPEFELLEVN